MTRLVAALALLLVSSAARADDEGSEHTAQLAGASTDTLGVTLEWNDASGWSMQVRPAPGDDVITTRLALPKSHAHYVAYVAPGRTAIAFIEVNAGRAPTDKDTVAWVYSPQGTLLRSWTFRAILSSSELANTQVGTSHFSWIKDMWQLTPKGLELKTLTSSRIVTLAADATTFK